MKIKRDVVYLLFITVVFLVSGHSMALAIISRKALSGFDVISGWLVVACLIAIGCLSSFLAVRLQLKANRQK
jgi:hypothetical protein